MPRVTFPQCPGVGPCDSHASRYAAALLQSSRPGPHLSVPTFPIPPSHLLPPPLPNSPAPQARAHAGPGAHGGAPRGRLQGGDVPPPHQPLHHAGGLRRRRRHRGERRSRRRVHRGRLRPGQQPRGDARRGRHAARRVEQRRSRRGGGHGGGGGADRGNGEEDGDLQGAVHAAAQGGRVCGCVWLLWCGGSLGWWRLGFFGVG